MTFHFIGVRLKWTDLIALNVQNRPAWLLTTTGTLVPYQSIHQNTLMCYINKKNLPHNNNNNYYHCYHKRFSACFKFLDYKVLVYRYIVEGKQIFSVNGCTGQSKFLHVDFCFYSGHTFLSTYPTINRNSKLRPNIISTVSSTRQWASTGRFHWGIFRRLGISSPSLCPLRGHPS